jgi:hypothetical protein
MQKMTGWSKHESPFRLLTVGGKGDDGMLFDCRVAQEGSDTDHPELRVGNGCFFCLLG